MSLLRSTGVGYAEAKITDRVVNRDNDTERNFIVVGASIC